MKGVGAGDDGCGAGYLNEGLWVAVAAVPLHYCRPVSMVMGVCGHEEFKVVW